MAKATWWDWRTDASSFEEERIEMSEDERRASFKNLAERCIILDNLVYNVTHAIVRSALGQFGIVLGVKMVKNPMTLKFIGVSIVEMQSKDQRDQVVRELKEYLFMVGAMPRPARAIPATPLLLIDHPWRRNENMIRPRLVSKNEPGVELLRERERKAKTMAGDHEELARLMEEDEVKLAELQRSSCQELMEKLNMIAHEKRSGAIAQMKMLHGIGMPC